MAYLSLYRKYRPHTFSDVVGQRHVITALQNAIRDDSLHHAYLFAGPRGTGKTTIARILAMAVNAADGPTPEPDPEAPISRSIRDGNAVDVIEMDMASHGGVDDARELRDRAVYAPAELRRKVYILDEVHMASQAAFNALLKLIEEPPGHVLFAMATTDPQKVLPTILSRVQRLDLRRVPAGELGDHVRRIGGQEGFTIDDGALSLVLRAGDGSVRDTLSVLEQVLAYSGAQITADAAAEVLGRTPVERTLETVELIGAGDVAGLFALVHRLLDDGVDLRRFTLDLVHHLRDLLVVTVAPGREDLLDATDDQRAAIVGQVGALTRERLIAGADLLGQVLVEQRQAGAARLPLELALAKLAVPEAAGDVTALADRVGRLEAGGVRPAAASTKSTAAPAGAPEHGAATSASTPAPAEAPQPDPAVASASAPAGAPEHDAATSASTPAPVEAPQPDPAKASAAETSEPAAAPSAAPEASAPAPAPTPAPAGASPAEPAPAAPAPAEAPDAGEGSDEPSVDEQASAAGKVPPEERFAVIRDRWPTILEGLKERKRKAVAMYEPATPIAYDKGVLTLDYPQKYAKFHAKEALSADILPLFQETVQTVTGIRVRVETVTGGRVERAPQPPAMESGAPIAAPGRPPGPTASPRDASSAQPERAESSEPLAPPPDGPSDDDDPEPAGRTSPPAAVASEPASAPGSRSGSAAVEQAAGDVAREEDEASIVAEAEHDAPSLDLDQAADNVVNVLGATELDITEV